MDGNIKITIGANGLPTQEFKGKQYFLYPKERYFSRGNKRMHTTVYKFYYGDIPKNYHVHHSDGNTWNNEITNLQLVQKNKHLQEHGKERFNKNKEWFKDFHAKGIEKATQWHKSKEGIEWHSEQQKENWKSKQWHIKICSICNKEYKTPFPERSKYCHQNCKAKALRSRRKQDGKSL